MREVLCDPRKVHTSKNIWSMVPNDRGSVSVWKLLDLETALVTDKRFTEVGKEQTGLKNK